LIGQPGSIVWLLRHELRLDWRRRTEANGRRRWFAIVLTLGTPIVLGVVVGAPLGLLLRHMPAPAGGRAGVFAAVALGSTFMMMLSQALSAVVEALYERSDLDLLFASPISPLRVIVVRALAIGFASFSVFGFFSAGPLLVIALFGQPRWLAALPVLYGTALAATGLALMISLVLIQALGPRRTRMVGQALSVLIGSVFFLATQAFTFATPALGSRWKAMTALAASPHLQSLPFVDWGWRALGGEPGPFLAVMSLQLSVFLVGVVGAGPQFSRLYAAAAGAALIPAPSAVAARGFRQGPFRASLLKEIRLLRRDPLLLPQILLRVVYLAPLGFLAVRYGAGANITALPGAIMALTLMTHQLAGSLAWLTISAEDAPELLASAPARPRLIMRAKMSAVALTVAMVFAPVAIALLLVVPREALFAIGGSVAATTSATLVNVWWQRPGKRNAFRQRAEAPWFVTLAELALALLIALSAGLLAAGQLTGFASAAAVLAILFVLRPRAPHHRVAG
jgi:ABC-2 type transport system permease protein